MTPISCGDDPQIPQKLLCRSVARERRDPAIRYSGRPTAESFFGASTVWIAAIRPSASSSRRSTLRGA